VISVVYGVDNRFAAPLAASIESALDSLGPGSHLDIHIIDGGLSNGNRSRLLRSFAGRPCRLRWLRPDESRLASLKVGGAITVATYYRLLIPDLVRACSKVIYLDADLIVRRDLEELWRVSLNGRHLLAVQDQGVRLISGPFGLSNYRDLHIPEDAKYFNAGVLVMDLSRWRKDDVAETILAYIKDHEDQIRFHDQDGLNAILWDRWGEIDPRWNQMPQILQVPRHEDSPFDHATFVAVVTDPYIVHYASAETPWLYGCHHPASTEFFRYLDRTEFRGRRPSWWRTRLGQWTTLYRGRLRRLVRRVSSAANPQG
jgi:lipopolysaccharide biosynthesis glycosyltransferase